MKRKILEILSAITGWPRRRERGDSEYARQVVEVIESMDLEQCNDEKLDYLIRVFGAGLSAIRTEYLSRQFHFREWKPKKWCPFARHLVGHHYQMWDPNGVVDHPKRLVDRETGREFFISEPYQLDNRSILELAELSKAGWDITICGRLSTHFSGDTFAVVIRRPVRERAAAQ